jgi:excisionase family DNA binding protein
MSTKELMEDGTLSIEAAVEFSGLGRSFLYSAMDRGELPYAKCGARRLIPKKALVKYLADRVRAVGANGLSAAD